MNYHEWNRAIAGYFISGLPAGTPVYLSVDEDALEDIGQRSGESRNDGTSWTEVFLHAICVIVGALWSIAQPVSPSSLLDHSSRVT
jgi:hypothetical protein